MYAAADIRMVHLEITSRCNAACPQCSRNEAGGAVNPHLPLTELSLADVQAIFDDAFVAQLDCMYMCGVYGDAMVAKDTLEVFEHFRRKNPRIWLHMITNGSGRTAAWWQRLAGVINLCTFSIDGLADTNAMYRRGTEWQRIMDGVRAFIGAGGKAVWEYLIFKHNEHQIDEARALSTELGFSKFVAKKTDRFVRAGRKVERLPVLNRDAEVEYFIEMPSETEMHNPAATALDKEVRAKGYQAYRDETVIDCKAVKRRSVYVTAEGLVLPCCWTGRLYVNHEPPGTGELWDLVHRLPGGKAAISARDRPLRDIVAGPLFQAHVPNTWQPGEKRLNVCARQCGTFDLVGGQFSR